MRYADFNLHCDAYDVVEQFQVDLEASGNSLGELLDSAVYVFVNDDGNVVRTKRATDNDVVAFITEWYYDQDDSEWAEDRVREERQANLNLDSFLEEE